MIKTGILLISFLLSLLAMSQQEQDSVPAFYKDKPVSKVNFRKGFKKAATQAGNIYPNLHRAKVLYREGRYGAAVRKFTESLERAQQNNNREAEAQALEGLGLSNSAFQNLSESIAHLKQALQINKEVSNTKGTVRILKILSDVYYSERKFDSALYYGSLSMQMAASFKMNNEIETARLSKTAALIRLKKWDEADKEISLFTKTPADSRTPALFVQFHSLTGNYYLAKGREDKAQLQYNLAINKAVTQNVPELLSIVYGNMIDSWFEKGDYKKGFEYFEQYKAGRKLMQSDAGTATVFNTDLFKNEIYNLNIEKKLKELQLMQEVEESKIKDVRLQQGEARRSTLQQQNYSKDSLLQVEKSLNAEREREAQKERDLLLRENLLLEKENYNTKRQKELDQMQARQLTINLTVGLCTALLLGSIIFYQYKKQRRKNIIIEKQKEELQTLMKEIHHRVKNNLQVISSLLDLQSQTIENSQASEAIKEGKNRVQSMALIHQNLYGDRSIQKINVKEYICSLCQGLIDSYHIAPGSIAVETDVDDLDLDVDTVIPLGLILNELISNSLKHAFKNGQPGVIEIALKQKDNSLFLKVKDNGKGFSVIAASAPSSSFGMKLIKAFATKLKAKMELYNEEGACVVMHIHKYKPAS
jgi:two-component sensor histidine kinase